MHYTFHQLQVFLEVVRLKSITRAAETMHMTQPALSIQLKNFQSQFDIPLTEVSGRQLYITDFGMEVAAMAEEVLGKARQIEYRTSAYKGLLAGKLRISSASTGKYVIPYFLSGFMHEHEGIDLTLDVTNKSSVINSLKNNEIDFALVSTLPDKLEVQEETLVSNHLFMVGGTEEPEADMPFIFRETGSATRQAMDTYLEKKVVRKRLELTSNEAVKQAVIARLGYSVIPLIGIHNELDSRQLHIYDRPGLPIITEWRLIWLSNRALSPAAEAYLKYVRKNKQMIIENHFGWIAGYIEDTV